MELLTSPKSMHLLEAGLEVLHEQSYEWLNEIAFWRDETTFFYSLIVKKTLKSVPVSAKNDIERIEKELVSITSNELDDLQKAVEQHESFLKSMLENHGQDGETYRNTHKQLTLRFLQFEKSFKTLKKDVFALVELINKNK